MKPIFLLLFILLYQTTHAQHAHVIPLNNPSLEGPTGFKIAPPGWDKPGSWGDTGPTDDTESASDQHTFVRLTQDVNSAISHQDIIGQALQFDLVAGVTYTLSFDMAASMGPGTMVLIGSIVNGYTPPEILWQSDRFDHTDWQRYTITFTPSKTLNYITLYPYTTPEKFSGGAKLDNFSAIKETVTLNLRSDNTCPGAAIGAVYASSPFADKDYTYLWQPGGYTTPAVHNLAAGIYEVTVDDTNTGMTATKSIEVKTSVVKAVIDVTAVSCYGKSDAGIQVMAAGGQLPYQYFLDDDNNTTGSFSNIAAGSHQMKISDSIGCYIEEHITVSNPVKLSAKITVKNIPCSDATNGQITLIPAGGTPPYTYSIPGSTSTADGKFSQLSPGFYHYVITDSHHCSIDSSITITKDRSACAVYVPNAFTPNGDGLNDVFHVRIQDDISDYRLAVYSRWGELIYETSQPEAGWDGTLKGVKLPAGTYVWSVIYTNSSHQPMKQQGTVLLIP